MSRSILFSDYDLPEGLKEGAGLLAGRGDKKIRLQRAARLGQVSLRRLGHEDRMALLMKCACQCQGGRSAATCQQNISHLAGKDQSSNEVPGCD